jgi:hypothetical protein
MVTGFLTAWATLLGVLASLWESARKNPWLAVITFIGLFLAVLTLDNRANLHRAAHPTPEMERDALDRSITGDVKVHDQLGALRGKTNADRVLVRQYTNGTKNLIEVPFSHIYTSHISLADGISVPASSNYPTSIMSQTSKMIWRDFRSPGCISQTVAEMDYDPAYKAYLQQHAVDKAFTCPLVSREGFPIGLLGIGYTDPANQPYDDQHILSTVGLAASGVAATIEEIKGQNAPEPWWKLW